jgi:hypothetical protein
LGVTFSLDIDLESASEISGELEEFPKGCYSFTLALQIAEKLADKLRALSISIESREIPAPASDTPRHLISENQPEKRISSAELEVV